jgi:hypothetical protein
MSASTGGCYRPVPAFLPASSPAAASGTAEGVPATGAAGALGGPGAPCGGRGAGCRACPRAPERGRLGAGLSSCPSRPRLPGPRRASRQPGRPAPSAVPGRRAASGRRERGRPGAVLVFLPVSSLAAASEPRTVSRQPGPPTPPGGPRAVAGVPDAGCVPVPRERGRLGAGPAFCPSRLRLRLSGPRMVSRQPGTAGAPGGSGAPCGGRGAGCRACPCTVGADAWEPVRLPARLVRGSGFWAADGVPATGGRWRSRDAVRWPGPPVPLAVPDAVRWPERRMPGGSPCTVGADAWEPVRCRSLGIRTDSWSPDWDTAATLPGPPVRPPVPVLS